ncbi:MAG: transposase [Rhodanobacteraceae bacterium]
MSKKYTKQFRSDAVAMVLAQHHTVTEAARILSVPMQTLSVWVKKHQKAVGTTSSSEEKDLRAALAEKDRLIQRLTLERDILKKATAFFAKENS